VTVTTTADSKLSLHSRKKLCHPEIQRQRQRMTEIDRHRDIGRDTKREWESGRERETMGLKHCAEKEHCKKPPPPPPLLLKTPHFTADLMTS
jgi:hypothetical protein